jgi:CDP-diacylglycerol--glycerol-3-phosphate 3-phosphatidyltransferase
MSIYATKPIFQRLLQPIVEVAASARLSPDALTYGALGVSALAGALLIVGPAEPPALPLAAALMLLRLGFNLLDGQIARALGIADMRGELKNEFGDRVADVFIFGGLLLSGLADARLAGLALAAILCVSYLGILSKALGGPRLYAGVFGKGERMVSLAVVTALAAITGTGVFNIYLVAALALAMFTIGQRVGAITQRT